jgi:HRAS-like suppressor 3
MSPSLHCASPWRRVVGEELPVGAHLMTPRLGYTHHGIHVGGGRVVHYAGLSRNLLRGPVEVVSIARFAGGRELFVNAGARAGFAPEEVVRRALSRLGEDLYRLTSNNCEHFCEWCRTGESRSEQVERITRRPRLAAMAVLRLIRFAFAAGGAGPATVHA